MAASQISLLLLTIFILSSSTSAIPTAYDVLAQFGFPPGILPDSVTAYSTSPDGSFTVYLAKPCYLQKDYLIYYDSEITGKASDGLLSDLKGFKAQSSSVWLNIDEIKLVGDSLEFSVGPLTVTSSVSDFETIPTCQDNKLAAFNQASKLKLPVTAE